MIWTLRHISILLWITSIVAIPVCFYVLPVLIRIFPQANAMVAGFVIIGLVVLSISFLMDMVVKKILLNLIKEGQAWERSGIIKRAEKKYIRAVRLYDSFLLWPLGSKKIAQTIAGVIARFQLNTGVDNENFKVATSVYLKMNPADMEISRLWLKRLRQSHIVTADEQDVLSVLAEVHDADPELSPLIADIFLGLERKDFAAQKLYTQMQKDPALDENYSQRIQDVIGLPEEDTADQDIVFSNPEPVTKRLWSNLKRSWVNFSGHLKPWMRLKMGFNSLWSLMKWMGQTLGSILSFTVLSVGRLIDYLNTHRRVRFYFKMGLLTLISGWLLFFMVGTVSHLFKSKPAEKGNQVVEEHIPKPFTIQVAAYLKQIHADRYVDILEKKGIEASVKKVAGGGKTWFVVRVSSFVDKKSATTYGQKLKQQKIIDDFFVNNN